MSLLDMSDKVDAKKIKNMCLQFLAENFELFAGPELVGHGTGQSLTHYLEQLDKELLIEIIKIKSEMEYKNKYM